MWSMKNWAVRRCRSSCPPGVAIHGSRSAVWIALAVLAGVVVAVAQPQVVRAQELEPFRVGLLLFERGRPDEAARAWAAAAEREALQALTDDQQRQVALGLVLATIGYDAADDRRAYATWAEAIQMYLASGSRWEDEQERLRVAHGEAVGLLQGLTAEADAGVIGDQTLMLVDFQEKTGLLEFEGPRLGLAESPLVSEVEELAGDPEGAYFARPLSLVEGEESRGGRNAVSGGDEDPSSEDQAGAPGPVIGRRIGPAADPGAQDLDLDGDSARATGQLGAAVVSRGVPAAGPSSPAEDDFGSTEPTLGGARRPAPVGPLTPQSEGPAPTAPGVPGARSRGFEEPELAVGTEDGSRLQDSESSEGVTPTPLAGGRRIDEQEQEVDPSSAAVALVDEAGGATIVVGPQLEIERLDGLELEVARTAWRYVQENLQPTGLINSVNQYATATAWEMGSMIAALVCADQLQLVSEVRTRQNLDRLLQTLETLELYGNDLPNLEYSTSTASMVDDRARATEWGTGWSAVDTGRLLVWLRIAREWYPERATQIERIVERLQLERAVVAGELVSARRSDGEDRIEQQGRFGYEQYAAVGFALWGQDTGRALDLDEVRYAEVLGVNLPYDERPAAYLTSEPFVLSRMELGGISPSFDRLISAIYAVQKRRWEEEEILTAVSEDVLPHPPWFIYNTIYRDGSMWSAINPGGREYPEYRGLSTKAAFAWHALMGDDYTDRLRTLAARLVHERYGFLAGMFESGETNRGLSLNTNAVILESLLYQQRGREPFLRVDAQAGGGGGRSMRRR